MAGEDFCFFLLIFFFFFHSFDFGITWNYLGLTALNVFVNSASVQPRRSSDSLLIVLPFELHFDENVKVVFGGPFSTHYIYIYFWSSIIANSSFLLWRCPKFSHHDGWMNTAYWDKSILIFFFFWFGDTKTFWGHSNWKIFARFWFLERLKTNLHL